RGATRPRHSPPRASRTGCRRRRATPRAPLRASSLPPARAPRPPPANTRPDAARSRRSPRSAPSPARRDSEAERVRRASTGVGEDRVRLEIQVERLEGELAAAPRLLVAAERNAGNGGVRHVDGDRPRLD